MYCTVYTFEHPSFQYPFVYAFMRFGILVGTTCTWSALMAQRMSVALHMAAAWEIARELSLAGAEDEAALFGGGVADSVA